MKKITVQLIASLLVATQVSAALLIYKGADKVNYRGPNRNLTLIWNNVLLIDQETGNMGSISYVTYNKEKRCQTSSITNLHFIKVSGVNGITYTAISRPLSQCALDEGLTTEGVLVQGENKLLIVDANGATTKFPQTLTGSGHSCSPSESRIVNVTKVVSFDKLKTQTANNSSETLEEAMARLLVHIEGSGYTRLSLVARKAAGNPEELDDLSPADY